jgi:hypothetical protein
MHAMNVTSNNQSHESYFKSFVIYYLNRFEPSNEFFHTSDSASKSTSFTKSFRSEKNNR